MTGDQQPDAFPDIPILLEPVVEADPAAAEQAVQRVLFADLPAATEATARRGAGAAAATRARTTAALAELNRRAPAIVEGLVDAHAGLLKGLLRERLHAELEQILREMPAEPPAAG